MRSQRRFAAQQSWSPIMAGSFQAFVFVPQSWGHHDPASYGKFQVVSLKANMVWACEDASEGEGEGERCFLSVRHRCSWTDGEGTSHIRGEGAREGKSGSWNKTFGLLLHGVGLSVVMATVTLLWIWWGAMSNKFGVTKAVVLGTESILFYFLRA